MSQAIPRVFCLKHRENRKLLYMTQGSKPICPICNQKMYFLVDENGKKLNRVPKKTDDKEWDGIEKRFHRSDI